MSRSSIKLTSSMVKIIDLLLRCVNILKLNKSPHFSSSTLETQQTLDFTFLRVVESSCFSSNHVRVFSKETQRLFSPWVSKSCSIFILFCSYINWDIYATFIGSIFYSRDWITNNRLYSSTCFSINGIN